MKDSIKKMMKLDEVVKLNIAESEVQLGRSWNLVQKLNYLTPVLSMGFTDGTYILVVNGVVIDGRQSIIALREYLDNKLGADNSNLPSYNSLDKHAKDYLHNLEFAVYEGNTDMDEAEMFKSLNMKLESKDDGVRNRYLFEVVSISGKTYESEIYGKTLWEAWGKVINQHSPNHGEDIRKLTLLEADNV